MKNLFNTLFTIASALIIISCGGSKNATGLRASEGNLDGTWTLSNILVDVPEGFKVTDVFDEGPYQDFQGSNWNLIRNGKGSYTLASGKNVDIYWTINGKGPDAQFQFKKLIGEKARNVEEGYRLQLQDISSDSFTAKSPVDIGNGQTGYITYIFTK